MGQNLTRLNVALTLATGPFTAGAKGAAATVDQFGKSIRASLLSPLAALGGMLSAGALVEGMRSLAKQTDSLAKSAEALGVTTQAMTGLHYAAEKSGASAEMVDKALAKLQVRTEQAADGNKTAADAFANLGMSFDKLQKMTADQKLAAIADAISNMKSPSERTAAAVAIFGDEASKLTGLLSKGSAGIKEMTAEAKSLGLVLDTQAVESLRRTNEAIESLTNRAKGAGQSIAAYFSPAVELLATMADTIQESIDNKTKYGTADPDEVDRLKRVNAELEQQHRMMEAIRESARRKDAAMGVSPSDRIGDGGGQITNMRQDGTANVYESNGPINDRDIKQYQDRLVMDEMAKRSGESLAESRIASREAELAAVADIMQRTIAFEQTMDEGVRATDAAKFAQGQQDRTDQWSTFYDIDILSERARQDGLSAEESRGFVERLKAGENYHAVEIDMAKAAAAKKQQIQEAAYNGFRNMLSNLSTLQQSSDKRAQAIGKAAAKASIIVNTADAAMKSFQSLAGIPYVGPYLGAAAAAAAVAAGAVQYANVEKGSMGSGGSTSIDTSNTGGAGGGATAPENRQTVLVQGDYLTPETLQRIFADAKERGIMIDGVRRA